MILSIDIFYIKTVIIGDPIFHALAIIKNSIDDRIIDRSMMQNKLINDDKSKNKIKVKIQYYLPRNDKACFGMVIEILIVTSRK